MSDFSSMYAYRHLEYEDAQAIIAWAHSQGIETTLPSYDLHVTVMYSESPFGWSHDDADRENLMIRGGERRVSKFGENGNVLVLEIESEYLQRRHQELVDRGAMPSHAPYRPHITITYNAEGVDESQITPYTGDIRLSGEWMQPVTGNPYGKSALMSGFQSFGKAQVLKVHPKLGLVVGYAIVSKINGEDYFDHHGDHIPEDAMLEATVDFMKSSRVSADMHTWKDGQPVQDGEVVFAFPMTTDIAKSLGITVEKTGLIVGIMPSKDVLAKFESGEYTGFSIGGRRIEDEEVTDA